MKIKVSEIYAKAKARPEGYAQTVLSKGTLVDGGKSLDITPEAYQDLLKQYDPSNAGKPIKGICPTCNSNTTVKLSEPKAKAFPPVTTQILNAAKSASKIAANVLTNKPLTVSDAEQQRRLDICAQCPEYKDGRCAKCGCFTKFKTKLETEHCPIGSW